MIELHFHRDLYEAAAVAEAAKTYGAYGTVDVTADAEGFRTRITATAEGIDDRTLAAELSNFVLGMTVEQARATSNATATEAAK